MYAKADSTDTTRTSRFSRSVDELNNAVGEFKEIYEKFAAKNKQFFLLEDELGDMLQIIESKDDFQSSAKLFEHQVQITLQAIERKQKSTSIWTNKLGTFLKKIYPVIKLSSNFIITVAEVS